MRLFVSFLSLIILALSVLHCSEQALAPQPADPNPEPGTVRTTAELTPQETSVLASSNKFGLNLFREITACTPATDNIFFSPLSASYALAMCYNGAGGDTRAAIGATLETADLSLEDMNQAFQAATRILIQADSLVDFRAANSFWSRQGKAIQPDFVDLAQTYYDARVEEMDFQAPWAADTINAWVDWATNGKITHMVEPPIDPDVAAMLFNAIYFKGSWMFPFDTAGTRTETFYLADGSDTQCRMMHLSKLDCLVQYANDSDPVTDTNITYYEDAEVLVLGIPYGSGDFRMSIVIPNRWYGPPYDDTAKSIDEVISGLTAEKWGSWISGHTPDKFYLSLPRFKFEYEIELTGLLKMLGMEIAFTPGADFTNLFVDSVGWIDEVKQKTFVQVDEKGTEAAVVTQVVFIDSAPPPHICDRPFLIVIHEDNSGAVLFMGRIANPVWED